MKSLNRIVKTSKPLIKAPFEIFKDPILDKCQHCGTEKQKFTKNINSETVSTGVQVENVGVDLDSWLCVGTCLVN